MSHRAFRWGNRLTTHHFVGQPNLIFLKFYGLSNGYQVIFTSVLPLCVPTKNEASSTGGIRPKGGIRPPPQ